MDDDWKTAVTSLNSWNEFDEYFQRTYIETKVFKSGCTIAIVNNHGVVHRKEFGNHKADAIYCSYSCTKMVTAIATLQMRDAGKLTLDDHVSKFLPSWKDSTRDALPNVQPKAVTIRQVLNHTSGVAGDFMASPCMAKLEADHTTPKMMALATATLADHVDYTAKGAPALYEPGKHFSYGDVINACARVVEILSGLSFEDYVHKNIFQPLGMTDMCFFTTPEQTARYPECPADAWLLAPSDATKDETVNIGYDFHTDPAKGGRGDGGLKGSVDDWVKLNRCLLNGGELNGVRILTTASVTEMATSSIDGAELISPFSFATEIIPDTPSFHLPQSHGHIIRENTARWANHLPGQSMGLGNAVITKPSRATLLDDAEGLAWWAGMASTYFGYSPSKNIGILLYGAHLHAHGSTRCTGGWRDVINAAFHFAEKA